LIITGTELKKRLLIVAGTLAVILGVMGIFLPVLPTTPFLLLAAYCYARSSQKLHRALLNNRFFGTYLRNYLVGRGMSLKYKVLTLALLWLLIGATVAFATDSTLLRAILGVVAAGVTIHILSIKTLSAQSELDSKQAEKIPLKD
jgi:uncharacterized membrane protein YbaN (DUF454 family)